MVENSRKKISRIRTGGQSGVDRAAMDFAREHDIPLCGWCPKDGWAEDYPDPPGLLSDYPELTETSSKDTEQRTRWNMRDCDAIFTIIPGGSVYSKGTEVGLEEGRNLEKPMYTASGIEDVPEIIQWIKSLPDGTELCIGGPRASECPDAYVVTKRILEQVAEGIEMKQVPMHMETYDAISDWRKLLDGLRKNELVDFMMTALETDPYLLKMAYAEFSDLANKSAGEKIRFLKEQISDEVLADVPNEDYIVSLAEILKHHLAGSEKETYCRIAAETISDAIEDGIGVGDCDQLSALAAEYRKEGM